MGAFFCMEESTEAPPAANEARRFRGSVMTAGRGSGWEPADTTVSAEEHAKKITTRIGGDLCDCPQVLLSALPHIARKGECEGGTFDGFTHSRSITRPQATTFAQQKCRTKKEEAHERVSLLFWCERWDLNPHDLTDTSTSSLPVCRFQHARGQDT